DQAAAREGSAGDFAADQPPAPDRHRVLAGLWRCARRLAADPGQRRFVCADVAHRGDEAASRLRHDPEKWEPVFGKDHALSKMQETEMIQFQWIRPREVPPPAAGSPGTGNPARAIPTAAA